MNERIQELLKQAAPRPACTGDWYSMSPGMVEKFAELIVRECIERVRSQCIPVRDSTIEGRPNPFFPDLRVRTEREQGIVECGVASVIAMEELVQESTDKWHKENILDPWS